MHAIWQPPWAFSRWDIPRWLLLSLTIPLLNAGAMQSAQAQGLGTREYPSQEYYLAFRLLDDGDIVSALEAFGSAGKAGIRSTEGRWVDSICYYTMIGECQYRMGNLAAALDQYTRALNLFVTYPGWMLRVDFAPGIDPSRGARRPPTWGASNRRAVAGRFVDRYQLLRGRWDNERVIVQGGILDLPEIILVNAHEIARCSALASTRRREIMGSACRHDPLTRQVHQSISVRPGRQNHWSQAWIDVQLGAAAAAAGKTQEAITDLSNGILAAGSFDHPLSPLAMLELGRLAFGQQQYAAASNFFREASLSAASFEQLAVVEEALRLGAKTHLVMNQQVPFPSLGPAISWARRESRLLETSLLVAAAENAASLGQTRAAAGLVEQARRRMVRTEMAQSSVGAHLLYATALTNYQAGNLSAGDTAFASLMKYQQRGSQRLFEITLVDGMYGSGIVSDRVANTLYAEVLREPTAADWVTEPVETQTVLLSPLAIPLEHWLATSLIRRENETAIEITDRIRRHRFFSTLPMGGRLLTLRWVLEGPQATIGKQALLQRQAILGQFPRYGELSRQSAAVRQQLKTIGLAPEDEADKTKQANLFQRIEAISRDQELLLREIALRRAPGAMVFPPPLDFGKAQSKLAPGQLVLSVLVTRKEVYLFQFGRDGYSPVKTLSAPGKVEAGIVRLLRGLGQLDKNQPLTIESLQDTQWQAVAAELVKQLGFASLPLNTEELIIVPDGPFWYLPFEALQIPTADGFDSVISRYRVRYAPTVALAFPDERRLSSISETAVVTGRLFPRDDESVATAAAEELRGLLPKVSTIASSRKVPGDLFAALSGRLIVFDDLEQTVPGPYGWAPVPLSRGGGKRPLSRWMALPWGGPQQIVLPGYHTAAEVSLKRGGNGNEVFLSLCGLMSTGARTILLSRWRPGGQSSYDLVREFAQELPFTAAADAWQRSVQLVSDSPLIIDREPRVAPVELDPALKSDHPFFWAGYLLVDSGVEPLLDDLPPAGK